MLEKPNGLKALREFFFADKKGNLVQILLSFTGTNLSQIYSQKVLKFFEKLFHTSENSDSPYSIEEVCASLTELGNVDSGKLKSWLSHILLGPKGLTVEASSATSSNVPTPTNLGTASNATTTAPSLPNDKTNKSTASTNDPDAMEIDEECSRIALNASASASALWQPPPIVEPLASESTENNGKLLQVLTKYLVTDNRVSANVSQGLFTALIQLGNSLLSGPQVNESILSDFTDLLQVMITLADADQGKGHSLLFTSAIEWLDTCKNTVLEKYGKGSPPPAGAASSTETTKVQLDNVSSILKYMSDLLNGLNGLNGAQRPGPSFEDDIPFDIEDQILDETMGGPQPSIEEDDSNVEDSDEDSLSNMLCTFSVSFYFASF